MNIGLYLRLLRQQSSKCQVHRLIAHLILIANGGLWSSSSLCWSYLSLLFKFIENNCPRKIKMMVVTTSSGDNGVVAYHLWPETSPSPSAPEGRGVPWAYAGQQMEALLQLTTHRSCTSLLQHHQLSRKTTSKSTFQIIHVIVRAKLRPFQSKWACWAFQKAVAYLDMSKGWLSHLVPPAARDNP